MITRCTSISLISNVHRATNKTLKCFYGIDVIDDTAWPTFVRSTHGVGTVDSSTKQLSVILCRVAASARRLRRQRSRPHAQRLSTPGGAIKNLFGVPIYHFCNGLPKFFFYILYKHTAKGVSLLCIGGWIYVSVSRMILFIIFFRFSIKYIKRYV